MLQKTLVLLFIVGVVGFCEAAAQSDASAVGTGNACAWLSPHGVEAQVEGALEFTLFGLTLSGYGHGTGLLDVLALSGWAWAVVWAQARPSGGPAIDLVGGLAVEGSPALGSGSVEGVCYLILRQAGAATSYRGRFVTQASSHLVPSTRPGTLSLEGDLTLSITLLPCTPADGFPWDVDRWPPELLAELLLRLGPTG